ncbi:protein artemis-like [Rhopilema esculentum]|uniref:protein artemis-like n=1 Tax=Rhopilema esculentum TaxID=499914 RepID=UPI0031E13B00
MANGAVLEDLKVSVDLWTPNKYPWVKYYFLTHMHADHTVGLTPSWRNKIYCSEMSKRLLMQKFGFADDLVISMELGIPAVFYKDGTESFNVTFYDANHCPGSVILVFEGRFGRILYTGDFRCDQAFLENFKTSNLSNVDRLYLDNTYFSKRVDFPPRETVTKDIIKIIRSHPGFQVIIVCYNLGKEDLLVEIAMDLREWIVVSQVKYDLLEILEMPNVFTIRKDEGRIRAIVARDLAGREIKDWIESVPTIAIFPTGMFNKENNPYKTNAFEETFFVPYSDHSSYSEIVEFLKYVKPGRVIPLVKDKNWDYNEIVRITKADRNHMTTLKDLAKEPDVVQMEMDDHQNLLMDDELLFRNGDINNDEFKAGRKKSWSKRRPKVPAIKRIPSNKGVVFDKIGEENGGCDVTGRVHHSKSHSKDTSEGSECTDMNIVNANNFLSGQLNSATELNAVATDFAEETCIKPFSSRNSPACDKDIKDPEKSSASECMYYTKFNKDQAQSGSIVSLVDKDDVRGTDDDRASQDSDETDIDNECNEHNGASEDTCAEVAEDSVSILYSIGKENSKREENNSDENDSHSTMASNNEHSQSIQNPSLWSLHYLSTLYGKADAKNRNPLRALSCATGMFMNKLRERIEL